jgi:serine protease
VCVADSGTDITHPDLLGRLDSKVGYNAIDKNNNVSDGLKHGTHVAGIVAAIENNGKDVAGVGTDRVNILTCKFLNAQGYGFASDAVACIDYCLENGADIITNSWSGGEDNPALREAIQHSFDKDVLFVVAAGNTASDLDTEKAYPASYAGEFSNMLVVASTNYQDKLSNFSNYGADSVHLGAPGEW